MLRKLRRSSMVLSRQWELLSNAEQAILRELSCGIGGKLVQSVDDYYRIHWASSTRLLRKLRWSPMVLPREWKLLCQANEGLLRKLLRLRVIVPATWLESFVIAESDQTETGKHLRLCMCFFRSSLHRKEFRGSTARSVNAHGVSCHTAREGMHIALRAMPL